MGMGLGMRGVARLLLGAALCSWASGCVGKDCSDEGCYERVEVRFAAPVDASQEISLDLVADGQTISCTHSETQVPSACYASNVLIQSSGGSVTGFSLVWKLPKKLSITVSTAGSVIVSKSVSPTYVESHPNGFDCGPTCHSAVVQL